MPAPVRRWANLPPDLLRHIGEGLDLECYASARRVCPAWRCALAPLSPSLLFVLDCRPSAASLATDRSVELNPIPSGARCVGSSNGWLALSVGLRGGHTRFSLFNPVTATEIILPPLIYDDWWRSKCKLVFAPDPARDDFAAATICGLDTLAYVTAGARRWAVLDPVRLAPGDQFADVVYREKGREVYCLTLHGDVHVLRLPPRRRREPIMADDPPPRPAPPRPESPHLFILFPAEAPAETEQHLDMIRRRSSGPHENAPATVEPLLSLPFEPATSFATTYQTVSAFTSAKNLVFCEGNLYQVWRNASCTVTARLPRGGHRRIAENEVFVLRYYPQRQPCWDAVADLGGHSVFVGINNAVSMYAEDVPGLEGNCVYWIGGSGRDQGMVFDMATGTSTPCMLPAASPWKTAVCWYFLSDMVNHRNNNNEGKIVHRTPVREPGNMIEENNQSDASPGAS